MLSSETQPESTCAVAGKSGKLRRRLRLLLYAATLCLGIPAGLETWRVVLGANIHAVAPGKVYRGAQPNAAGLEALADRYHIRTVVNLRGACDPNDWFTEEIKATQSLQMSQEDICMASGRLPSDQELRKLVDVLDHAEYPLFLHCRRGADRTGVAAAVYMLLETDATFAEARRQLGMRYGHVALGRTALMDQLLDFYQDWLRAEHKEHARALFRHWVLHEYHGAGYDYRIESLVCATASLKTGEPMGFEARVRNTGSKPWQLRPVTTGGMKLGFCLRNDKEMEVTTGYAGLFDAVVSPGEAVTLAVIVPAVARAGRYHLTLDMVHPDFVWFFQMGSEPREEELTIRE